MHKKPAGKELIWIGSFARIKICLRMNIHFLDAIHFTVQNPVLHLLIQI